MDHTPSLKFQRQRHIAFFSQILKASPSRMTTLDTNRMMILYFCCSALDILGAIEDETYVDRDDVVAWILQMQVLPMHNSGFVPDDDDDNQSVDSVEGHPTISCGFIGGGFLGSLQDNPYAGSHISMTYTALMTLAILGHDFEGVDRAAILHSLGELQMPDGRFQAVKDGTESDARFVFCAAAICFMLGDFSTIDCDSAAHFLMSCVGFDGGVGLKPGLESHGGSTYCAMAALRLMGRLDVLESPELVLRFLCNRQVGGFNGRINKAPDTCYTFWVGGCMQVLGATDMIDVDSTTGFLNSCQALATGGYSKVPMMHADPLHAYYGLCGMSILHGTEDSKTLLPIDCVLGMTLRSFRKAPFARGLDAKGKPYVKAESIHDACLGLNM